MSSPPLRLPDRAERMAWPRRGAYAGAALVCAATAALALPLAERLDAASLVLFFLLAVVLSAAWFGRGPAVLAALLSVLLFNLLFVPPRLSLAVADPRFLFTFAVMLFVGLVVGQLTARLRAQARAALEREQRVRSLYDVSRELGSALTTEEVERIGSAFVRAQLGAVASLRVGPAAPAAADAAVLELPLRGTMAVRGVMRVQRTGSGAWSDDERRLLETCATLVGSALERIHYIEVAQDSAVQIEGERLRNSLLSAISHDLRTPLAALVGLAESLRLTRPAPTVQQAEIADAIAASARRMSALVHNLLDMARLEAGRVQLNLAWQPLEELVGPALAATGALLAQHHVEVRLPDELPLLRLDAVLIERVLVNLLENAAKYTPPGSTVSITAATRGDEVELAVADDGPGLPDGRADALFRKFERGRRESATPGAGLGLALCRAIVEAHGGRIVAESPPGGGARFVMRFARGHPPPPPLAEPVEAGPA